MLLFWDNRKKQWRRDKISFSIKPFIVDSEFKYEGYLIAYQNETNKILGIYIITKDLQKESMISTINKQFEKVIVDNISQIELIYKMKKNITYYISKPFIFFVRIDIKGKEKMPRNFPLFSLWKMIR